MTLELIVGNLFGFMGMFILIKGGLVSDRVRGQMHRIEGLLCVIIALILGVLQ